MRQRGGLAAAGDVFQRDSFQGCLGSGMKEWKRIITMGKREEDRITLKTTIMRLITIMIEVINSNNDNKENNNDGNKKL